MNALILLSGGLDSAVLLAMALKKGRKCRTLSFDYGQRHRLELRSARNIARHYGVPHQVIKIDNHSFGKSSLVSGAPVPRNPDPSNPGIPSTYVPARNTLFLSFALGQAELHQIDEIYFGPNKDDFSAYPDCRPEFVEAYQSLINVATKQSVEAAPPKIISPFLQMDKVEIVRMGKELKVPFHLTLSCYDPSPLGMHCGACLSCTIRFRAFEVANVD